MGPLDQIVKITLTILCAIVAMKVASKIVKIGFFCAAFVFMLLFIGVI